MSNVVKIKDVGRVTGAPLQSTMKHGVATPPLPAWRSDLKDDVRRSLRILNLAAQLAREMTAQVSDPGIREILFCHVDAIDALLVHARKLA
jgi:hypothetical protein